MSEHDHDHGEQDGGHDHEHGDEEPSREVTVAGLTLKVSAELSTPLGAVIVFKALDQEGEVSHFIAKSDDVSLVEAIGMLIVASDEFRADLADLARERD